LTVSATGTRAVMISFGGTGSSPNTRWHPMKVEQQD
jgi:hypothetical protein